MGNPFVDQLVGLLNGLKDDTQNLHKSLDDQDEREETQGDLSNIFGKFAALRSILSKMDASDTEQIQDELKKVMSGQENISEIGQKIRGLLMTVKNRTDEHAPTRDKVADNLPDDKKEQDIGSIFDNFQGVLNNVQHWIDSTKAGSR
jgi:hypothetical protein